MNLKRMKAEFSRMNKMLAGAILYVFVLIMSVSAQVLINELMPSNTQTYADMWDFEDFPDWIELYNPSTAQVDLSGYYLSDDFNDLKQWAFPSGTNIQAGGYLIIIADGYDTKPGETFTRDYYPWNLKFQTRNFHTNFKLSADGDKLILSKDNGVSVAIVDSVSFPAQYSDISVGRDPSGNTWGAQFDLPTPGAANTSDPKNTGVFSGTVSFSVPGGFYDAAQTVTLSASAGDIYYTTDGSIPDKRSQKYSSPLNISKTTSLRARCIENGKFAGKTGTNTYFIGEKKRSLMVINLSTDSELLYNKDYGVFENSLKGRELPVAMEFFTTEGKQIVKVNAGLRLGSLTNFTCPQKPMQVALKGGKYGDDFIWNQLFDKPVACFVGLRLRQGGDAWGSNLIADGLLESICRNQLEVGYQAYRPVVVYINGTYYGLHDLREQFDDQYFTNNYNVDPTSKQEVRSILAPPSGKEGWEVVSGSWDSWQAIVNYVKNESMADDAKYEEIKSQVNINSLIDFVALQEFGCNVSWGHNEDIWKTGHTKWQWLVTDFDRCFVNTTYGNVRTDILNNGGSGLSKSIMSQDTLFSKLMNNAGFKAYAIQRMAAHLNSTFKSDRIHAFIDSMVTIMTPEMEDYVNAWKSEKGALQSVAGWKMDVDSVKTFISDRPQYVFQHLSTTKFAPSGTAELTITLSDTKGGEIYINQVRMNQGLSAMKFFKNVPLELSAVAYPGYVFAGWSEEGSAEILTLTLTGNKTLQAKFVKAEDHVIPSVISENTTFNLTDHPYVGNGDIKVAKGVTLTIEKGVTVLMSQNANLRIEGRLLINGTVDAPVKITHNESAGALNWGAINFYSNDTSKMTHVVISGTTLGSDALNERAGINGNYSNVIMDHLTLSNVIYPFYFEYGTTVLKNSSITIDHICNGGIHIGRGGALVENNYWVSTGKTINTDAIDIKGVTDGIIRGNRLYNFNGFNSDGIDLGEGAKNILVEGNYIYGNRDKGISVGGGSTCIVKNNIIVGCDLGIGIKDEGSKAELDHNTFIRNRIAVAAYTKVFGRGGGTAVVKNSILSASSGPSYYTDEFSSATFSYCLSDKDVLMGTGNICADPRFADMMGFNFQLKEESPCINAGDPSSPKDDDGSNTEIGAPYNYNQNDFPEKLITAYKSSVVINELMVDDSKDLPSGDWIELYNSTDAPVAIGNWKIAKNSDIEYWENIVDITAIDSSKFFTIPANTTLPANGFIVICKDLAAFKAAYPDVKNCIGNLPFGMDNKETIVLFNSSDSLVNSVSYEDKKPWVNPKSGVSYELKKATSLNYMPSNWGVSKMGGTPGGVNVATPVIGGIAGKMLPSHFFIAQNYPNPFRLTTIINFALPQAEHVTISVYNFAGRLVKTLVNSNMDAGYHKISWNAQGYSPGVYIYRIQCGSFMQSRKVTIQ